MSAMTAPIRIFRIMVFVTPCFFEEQWVFVRLTNDFDADEWPFEVTEYWDRLSC